MSQRATLGQFLINKALPEDLRDYQRVWDKAGMTKVLRSLAEQHPEQYREVLHNLTQVAREAATATGGHSFGLQHLRMASVAKQARVKLKQQMRQILDDDNLDDDTREEQIFAITRKMKEGEDDAIYDESLKEENPLAYQVLSGSRGNKGNLASLRGSDALYEDHRGRVIPVPVLHSYSQGLSPLEYWAGSYGARKGVLATKLATASAGFLSKQLNQASHRLLISELDDEKEPMGLLGLPVDTDDDDSEGSLLAAPIDGYQRNTVLTPKILRELRAKGTKRILVRSPAVGGPADGGLYARDAGVREKGGLPPRGEMVGMIAASALCLDKATLVRMADGTDKTIGDIRPGELVMTCSRQGVMRPGVVVQRYDNGPKDCYETVFRLGTGKSRDENYLRMVSTLDHKILGLSSYVPRQAGGVRRTVWTTPEVLPVGVAQQPRTSFYAKLPSSYDDCGHVSEPFALALGLVIGDGCYTGGVGGSGVGFSCHDEILIEDTRAYFAQLGLRLVAQSTYGEYRISDLGNGKRRVGTPTVGVRNPLRAKLLEYGLWGQYSHQKVLPDIRQWDNQSVASLIAGLWATDGTVAHTPGDRCMLQFSSNSYTLVQSVRELLSARFGIYSAAIGTDRKNRPDGTPYRDCYKVSVCSYDNIRKFHDVITIPGVKGPRLSAVMVAWAASQCGSPRESGRCKLVSQTAVGMRETCDLEVDHPDHLFVLANGLVVHNSEPLSQGMLSSKHSGGVVGANKSVGGFEYINSLVQTPKVFPGGATHAEVDGSVERIEEAPAGGYHVYVHNQQYYVPKDLPLKVKKGQWVEAGDVLSEGIPNPGTIVAHKGIGEGRRYFINTFRDAYRSAGIKSNRRNIEVLSKGLINHVRLNSEFGDYVPDDVIPYSLIERDYQPRAGATVKQAPQAVGKYLERPYLHYTIGTKVRPSMLKDFQEFGVKDVEVHDDPPPFDSEMQRGMTNLQHDPDWMTQMYGSGLKTSLLEAAQRGATSDAAGTSFVPGLAKAVDFGTTGKVQTPRSHTWQEPLKP